MRSAVTRRWYSATAPSIVPESQWPARAVRDLADVDGEDRAAGVLDAVDDLGLYRERADEPVEVGDDDDVRVAGLDELDGAAEAVTRSSGAPPETSSSSSVSMRSSAVALAGRGDTLALLGGRDGVVAEPADADDADGATEGGRRDGREGEPAPDFTLPSDSGETVTLSSLRGKTVILYFYPKDDTPGCTKQACGIRDA